MYYNLKYLIYTIKDLNLQKYSGSYTPVLVFQLANIKEQFLTLVSEGRKNIG